MVNGPIPQSGPTAHSRPTVTVVLAMSADGKIADAQRSPARFGSAADKAHLEAQIAQADGVLFGGSTLRAYGTTLSVSSTQWKQWRSQQGKSPQPVQIVCSRSGHFDPDLRFFRQAVPRWLLIPGSIAHASSPTGTQMHFTNQFERVVTVQDTETGLDWTAALTEFKRLGLERIVVSGGGELVASLLAVNAIDDLWLTLCPLLLGGRDAPTPVEGDGFLATGDSKQSAPRLELISTQTIHSELFLHYRIVASA